MVIKFIKTMGVFALLMLLTGCPMGETNCNDVGQDVRVNDLVHILPFQATYNHGDMIVVKVSIPSVNTFGNGTVDIFAQTQDPFALISFATINNLLQGNSINIVTGIQGDYTNQFKIPYNPGTDSYELELHITLNRVGSYSFYSYYTERIDFQGEGDCNFYIINTSFQGAENQQIQFEVL